MSTSLEERLYARELRALYRATRQSPEPFTPAQNQAFEREARRRAKLRAQDPLELQAGEVVRLDGLLELSVDFLDLREHALRLGALGFDLVGGGRFHAGQRDGHKNRRENSKERRRRSPARANYGTVRSNTPDTPWGPGPSQVGHPSRLFGQLQRPIEPKTRVRLRITNTDAIRPNLLRSPTSWGRIQRGARRASWPS